MEKHILIFKIIDKIIRLFTDQIYPLLKSVEQLTAVQLSINIDDENDKSIHFNDRDFLFELINTVYRSFSSKIEIEIIHNNDTRNDSLTPNNIARDMPDNKRAFKTESFECFFDNMYLCCKSKLDILKSLYETFIDNYKNITKDIKNYIPLKETIFGYLDSYLKLLLTVYDYTEGNQKIGDSVICKLVNFGINFKKSEVSIYNPYLMDAILSIIDNLRYMLFSKEFFEMNPILREAYIKLLYNKMVRRLRRYTWETSDKVKNAAWIIFPDDNENCINVRKLSNIASYENIRPIRLIEKIENDFFKINSDRKNEINTENKDFNIAVVGELTAENGKYEQLQQLIDSLYEHINFTRDKSQKDYYTKIKINWHTSKSPIESTLSPTESDRYKDNIKIECAIFNNKYDDFSFIMKDKIDELIDTDDNEMVFILDCPFLYNDVNFVPDTKTLIYNLRQNPSYKDHYLKDDLGKSLLSKGKLGGLLAQAVGHMIDHRVVNGVIKPVIRQEIFDYVREYIHELEKKESVYIYISSKTGIDSTLYGKLDIVRNEQYNGKFMSVANFENITKNSKTKPFPSTGTSSIMFSLHQMIKNISADLYPYYTKLLSSELNDKNVNLINIFRETYIFLEYKNSLDKVEVKYYTDIKIANEKIIADLIDQIIKLYIKNAFSVDKEYMLDYCFITAMASSLLSGSANIENVIFRNLYYDSEYKIKLGKIERIYDIEDRNDAVENFKKGIWYKEKTLYNYIVSKSLDVLLYNGSKYTLLNDIKLNDQNSRKVFSGIREACDKMNYKKSTLYSNAVEMGK